MNSNSLFETFKALDIPMDNHFSDLYVPVNETTQGILETYEFRANVRTFKSAIDGELWYDIPFAYMPWWKAREVSQ